MSYERIELKYDVVNKVNKDRKQNENIVTTLHFIIIYILPSMVGKYGITLTIHGYKQFRTTDGVIVHGTEHLCQTMIYLIL